MVVDDRLLSQQGRCHECGTDRYTVKELNLVDGQRWICYRCFDQARYPGYGTIPNAPSVRRAYD